MHQQKYFTLNFLKMKYFVEKFPNYGIRILLIWHWLAKYHQSAVIHLNLTIITANVLIWRLKWSSIEAFPKILLDTTVFLFLTYFVKFYLLFIYLHIQPLIVVFIFSQVLPHLYTHTYKHWLWVFSLFAFLSFIYHSYIHTYNHWLWL